jgi:hypothetical protein
MKRTIATGGALATFSVLNVLLATSCATDDVVVATLKPAVPSEPSCASNADCQPTAYCDKAGCTDASGSCRLRPLLCDSNSSPDCGCDGVTYWNDCLRKQSGVASATDGECTTAAATCISPDASDCPVVGASCARLLPRGPDCSEDTIGACWMLPADCPPVLGSTERWRACSAANACDDTCVAIRSGEPHQREFGPGCL